MTGDAVVVSGLDTDPVHLTAAQLTDFGARLDGPVLRRDDPGWTDAIGVWNGMAARAPALVVQPTSARDVAAAVDFARQHRLRLSIKGAGHHIAGIAIASGGLTLDMSRMRRIVVDADARLVQAGPGCRLRDVDHATQEHGLATVLGFVSEVGIAGLTLGGGLGYLTRRFGWTVDNLHEVEMVTADGQILVANRAEHADLFWAVRGAGANLGVVTRFTYRLHEVGPTVYGGMIAWPFERADEVLRAYRALTDAAPRDLSVWLILMHAPPVPVIPAHWQGRKLCTMVVCHSGDPSRTSTVLAPILALADPVVNLLDELPYTRLQSLTDDGEPRGAHYYWKTEYVATLTDDLLRTARELYADCTMPLAELGFLHIGGALNEHDNDDGVVGNRDARFVIGANGMWWPGEPRAAAYRQWIRDAWTRLRPFSTGGNYINFQTADEGEDRVEATYGGNYDRLVEVKQKYDPDNLFRANRNVALDRRPR